jgi:hydroxylamine reductase
MDMFCCQCQEAAQNTGCTTRGVCGKTPETAGYQDLLIYSLKGIGLICEAIEDKDIRKRAGIFAAKALFATITNANFDAEKIKNFIRDAIKLREELRSRCATNVNHDAATWTINENDWLSKAKSVDILSLEKDEDLRSLQELTIYGLKGMAAYADHAEVLGKTEIEIYDFILEALAAMLKNLSKDDLIALVLQTGKMGVAAMALLDSANTGAYGAPEITSVNIGVRDKPGILISGHDLKDLDMLLKQTEGSGVDVYTHGEMLPAHYYPAFKKYNHFIGNYGNSWWKQDREFASFGGPVLMTTNCITPVKEDYKDRIFTTGVAGYPGVKHIDTQEENGEKDFGQLIELAMNCAPPTEIETGEITGGFAHNQVLSLADTIVDAVKKGDIKRFVVMGGCDGRQKGRSYFTEVAEELPKDVIILTAGCAKYRYNKLDLGDINGVPRVLDAGQCNDSYSLAIIALKLKEVFGLEDINDLPISYDIAWYEQKAVTVLLALLYLGVKGIRLGPTLPAFLSDNVVKVLVENFDIKPIGSVKEDVSAMLVGN